MLYFKEGVKFEVIDLNVCQNVESLWIKVKCQSESIVIGVMYRPPSADVTYYNSMLDQLDFIHANYDKVILMGDLNFNYRFDCELRSNAVFHIESMYSMKQLVTKPTRVTLSTSTLLDVILSNIPESHTKTGVCNVNLSDHNMVFTVLCNFKKESDHNTVKFRNYKWFDVNAFINDLQSCEALNNTEWSDDMVIKKWSGFKEAFIRISDKHAPFVTRRLKQRNNPWVTKEIIQLMYERDHVKKQAVQKNDYYTWDRYKELRNKVTNLLKINKKKYASEKINESTGNSAKM